MSEKHDPSEVSTTRTINDAEFLSGGAKLVPGLKEDSPEMRGELVLDPTKEQKARAYLEMHRDKDAGYRALTELMDELHSLTADLARYLEIEHTNTDSPGGVFYKWTRRIDVTPEKIADVHTRFNQRAVESYAKSDYATIGVIVPIMNGLNSMHRLLMTPGQADWTKNVNRFAIEASAESDIAYNTIKRTITLSERVLLKEQGLL